MKAGRTVTITERGQPIARIVPLQEQEETEEEAAARLLREGWVHAAPSDALTWKAASHLVDTRSPTAVADFLKQRGRSWEE